MEEFYLKIDGEIDPKNVERAMKVDYCRLLCCLDTYRLEH